MMKIKITAFCIWLTCLFVYKTSILAQVDSISLHLVLPGQLFIRGIDNNAGNGSSMVINLSNTVDLPRGTIFSITDSEYIGGDTTNSWSHASGGVSGISLKYNGNMPISRGSSICIVIPYTNNGTSQGIQSIELNGSSNSSFSYSGIGLSESESSVIPNIKLNKSGANHLYIMQSAWSRSNSIFQSQGSVIDGFVSIPGGTSAGSITTPPDLDGRNIIHQTSASYYAFVICNELLYFCNIIDLLNGSNNWTITGGTAGNDLDIQGICDAVCNVSQCDGGVEIQSIPLGNICDYDICFAGSPYSANFTIDNLIVDGISLDQQSEFTFPYCWDYDIDLEECIYSGLFSCSSNLPCVSELVVDLQNWLEANGYYYEDVLIEGARGSWCLKIIQTDAEFEGAYFNLDLYDVESIPVYNNDGTINHYNYDTIFIGQQNYNGHLTGFNCTDVLQRIVAIPHGCEDPDYLWTDNSSNNNIVLEPDEGYSVTVTCGDQCEYVRSGFTEPLPEKVIPKQIDPAQSNSKVFQKTTDSRESSGEFTIKVYPNPAYGKVYVEIFSSESDDIVLSLLSINGTILYIEEGQLENFHSVKVIDVMTWPDGIYIVKLISGTFVKNIKIAKISD